MTPKYGEYTLNGSRVVTLRKRKFKSLADVDSPKGIFDSKGIFDLSAVEIMCLMSSKKDGQVYKRRKAEKDSTFPMVANTAESTTENCHGQEAQSPMIQNVNKFLTTSNVPVPSSATINLNSIFGIDIEDTSSSSFMMELEKPIAGECSSANAAATDELHSARDLCISALRNCRLLIEPCMLNRPEIVEKSKPNCLLPCKSCGCKESPLKMIICDMCEAAFHASCCHPPPEEPLRNDVWYCQPCLRVSLKRKGTPVRANHESSLKRPNSYRSAIRIGKLYQVDVPDWNGPVADGSDNFDNPSEFSHLELIDSLRLKKKQSSSSVGNWIQCREVLNKAGTKVCGKWRRAPLFAVQTDEWDCSCVLPWDPLHADCNVPQELETKEVMRQLKFINMLKDKIGNGEGSSGQMPSES